MRFWVGWMQAESFTVSRKFEEMRFIEVIHGSHGHGRHQSIMRLSIIAFQSRALLTTKLQVIHPVSSCPIISNPPTTPNLNPAHQAHVSHLTPAIQIVYPIFHSISSISPHNPSSNSSSIPTLIPTHLIPSPLHLILFHSTSLCSTELHIKTFSISPISVIELYFLIDDISDDLNAY